jgi:hypothetical protein
MAEKFEIDLEPLHKFDPLTPAMNILESLLINYKLDVIALINISPDLPNVEIVAKDTETEETIRKILAETEDIEEAVEKIDEAIGFDAVIKLFDGYETAYAFVIHRPQRPTRR